MPRPAIFATALAVVLSSAAACGGSMQKPPPLLSEVRGYNDGVRWAQPERSALRVPPERRSEFVSVREEILDDLRVGDYEIKSIRYREARTRARVDVRYTWHLDSRGVVHETVARQDWERQGKLWVMVGEERVRGEPMPGLPEPEPEPQESGDPADADDGAVAGDDVAVTEPGDAESEVLFDSGPVRR